MPTSPQAPASIPRERGCPFDPPEEYRRLRHESPVSRLAFPDGSVGWLVTCYDDVRTVLSDPRFSARSELVTSAASSETRRRMPARPGQFANMDPPDHTRYRRLLAGQFTLRRMRLLTHDVERVAAECLDEMERNGPPTDLVESFAVPIPSLVICELLGVPYADRDEFRRLTSPLMELDNTPEQFNAARIALITYLRELVAGKQADHADDLLGELKASGELTDEELGNISMALFIGGHETTANMLALGTYALLSHPAQLEALRARPDLIDNAVEELLRYLTIAQFGRERAATADVELGGELIRTGDVVVVSLPSANRDPGRFHNPDELDVTRPTAGHVAFGHGVHQCIGQQLARMEMRVALPALFGRFPSLALAVPPDEIPMRDDVLAYGVHQLPVRW